METSMTIRVPLPIPRRPRGHASAKVQHHGAPRAEAPGTASSLRERVCAKLALTPGAGNADIWSALDARIARRSAPDAAAASLYARAFGGSMPTKPAAPASDLATKAGWGRGV
jgi:hypothetical protein